MRQSSIIQLQIYSTFHVSHLQLVMIASNNFSTIPLEPLRRSNNKMKLCINGLVKRFAARCNLQKVSNSSEIARKDEEDEDLISFKHCSSTFQRFFSFSDIYDYSCANRVDLFGNRKINRAFKLENKWARNIGANRSAPRDRPIALLVFARYTESYLTWQVRFDHRLQGIGQEILQACHASRENLQEINLSLP